jgi:hypothetical protein
MGCVVGVAPVPQSTLWPSVPAGMADMRTHAHKPPRALYNTSTGLASPCLRWAHNLDGIVEWYC